MRDEQPLLYDIPTGSRINCECSDGSRFVTFHKIDGMYSLCTTEHGGTVHLAAFTPLVHVADRVYELQESEARDG